MQVKGLSNIIALGEWGNYAIKDDDTVWAWGSNDISEGSYGALGDSSGPGARPVPFQVKGVSNVTQISKGGAYATIYVKDDGSVWGWGCYDLGQLGDGSTHSSRPPPVKFPSVRTQIDNVKKVSGSTALKDDGTVWQWGPFIGDPEPKPVRVNGLDHVVDISAGGMVKVALKDDGTVWGWGLADGGGLFGWPKVIGPDPAFNYVTKRDPVLIYSGSAQPTATVNPVDMNLTPVENSSATDQTGKSGIPAPGMNFSTVLLATIVVTAIYLMTNQWGRRR